MSAWAAKRFWTEVSVAVVDGGFGVALDARPLRTPAKSALVVPTRALAEAIAAEWRAVAGKVDPGKMPVTRMANSAIDKVRVQHAEVAALLADYGGTDHLCYRATGPEDLVDRQARAWDPLLDWADEALGARLEVGQGVMHVPQPPAALSRLAAMVAELDPFRLVAFHDLVCISGSLILALAVVRGRLDGGSAWSLSRIDEDWQAEIWGQDEDAEQAAELKRLAFAAAESFWHMVSGQ